MKKTYRSSAFVAALAVSGVLGAAMPASADSVRQLEARIAKLEAEAAASAKAPAAGQVTVASDVKLQLYGMIRAEAYKDFDYDMGNNSIGFGTITSASPQNGRFGAHAYQTRLGLRGSVADMKFNLETDFYGNGGGGMRIRHAYGEYAGFTLGQTWSNWGAFNPSGMWDFDGLPGGAGYRVMQARYTFKPSENLTASVSVEEDPLPWRRRPMLTGAVLLNQGQNAYKVTAMSRKIDDLSGKGVDGWGVSFSGNLKPWEGGALQFSMVTGEAMSAMLKGGTGIGRQADGRGLSSSYEIDSNGKPVGMSAYSIGVSHAITPKVELGAAIGQNRYDNFAGSTGRSIKSMTGAILTVKYRPSEKVAMGLDYMRFERKEFSGRKVDADRLLAVATFSF